MDRDVLHDRLRTSSDDDIKYAPLEKLATTTEDVEEKNEMLAVDLHPSRERTDTSESFSVSSALEVQEPRNEHHRHHRCPRKATAVAVLLVIIGIGCVSVGISRLSDGKEGFALIIVGCLVLVPGIYQSYVLFRAWRGDPSFSFNMIPAYD